jgi:hypothetical protein
VYTASPQVAATPVTCRVQAARGSRTCARPRARPVLSATGGSVRPVPLVYLVSATDRKRAWNEVQRRYGESRDSGRCHDRSVIRTPEQHQLQEYLGCLGEVAVAMHLGVEWQPQINVFHDVPDVAHVDVRSVNGCRARLIIRDNDPLPRPFVLAAHVGAGHMWVRGWLIAAEARRDEWVDDPGERRPSWFVPASALYPMNALPDPPESPI